MNFPPDTVTIEVRVGWRWRFMLWLAMRFFLAGAWLARRTGVGISVDWIADAVIPPRGKP